MTKYIVPLTILAVILTMALAAFAVKKFPEFKFLEHTPTEKAMQAKYQPIIEDIAAIISAGKSYRVVVGRLEEYTPPPGVLLFTVKKEGGDTETIFNADNYQDRGYHLLNNYGRGTLKTSGGITEDTFAIGGSAKIKDGVELDYILYIRLE